MVEQVMPVSFLSEIGSEIETVKPSPFTGNLFQDVLNQAIDGLNQISASEAKADALMKGYMEGTVELDDVLIASAEMNMLVQLGVTTLTTVVNTFKEITQMPV